MFPCFDMDIQYEWVSHRSSIQNRSPKRCFTRINNGGLFDVTSHISWPIIQDSFVLLVRSKTHFLFIKDCFNEGNVGWLLIHKIIIFMDVNRQLQKVLYVYNTFWIKWPDKSIIFTNWHNKWQGHIKVLEEGKKWVAYKKH